MSDALLKARDLWRRYPGEKDAVLRGVSLSVSVGESVAIVGPSGCGKSTLLHVLGALDQPDEGEVEIDGVRLGDLDEAGRTALRRDRLGFVFQDHHLLPQCTALENVLLPTLADRWRPTQTATARAEALLEAMGLADRMTYRPGQLSTGQRQRVAVARALMRSPRLLLADEPTGSLSEDAAARLVQRLVGACTDTALVLVTHASAVAGATDRVLRLEHGQLVPDAP